MTETAEPTQVLDAELAARLERLRQEAAEKEAERAEMDRQNEEFKRQCAWEREHQLEDHQVQRVRDNIASFVPPRYSGALVNNAEAQEWLEDVLIGDGEGLLLLGATGRGKTHLAYGLIRSYLAAWAQFHQSHGIVAGSLPELLAKARPGAPRGVVEYVNDPPAEPIDVYREAPLLFIDDLGAEKPSEWTTEVLYRIIDHRYNYMLPTIVASNLPPAELAGVIGDRLASRLTEMCRTVIIKGDDRRRAS